MEKTEQKRIAPFGFGDNNGYIMPLVNVRKTHRNDPCPCGQTKVITYPGTQFPEKEVPVKFKKCCLSPSL